MPIQTAIDSISNSQGSPFGFKNRIINGGMVIDQRNAGASLTVTASAFTVDRWEAIVTQSSKFTVQQNAGSVTPPVGFRNYLGVTSTSAYSVVSSDFFAIRQKIEGFNIADLDWGTANAQTVTLSFWVRSSLTGTFGGSLYNSDGSRSYPFTYTINSANTWEYETITIAGDTTGTWGAGNGAGIQVNFGLGVGSTYNGTAGSWVSAFDISATGATSVVGTNGATFYITGVQLEKGSTATAFDYRPFGTELQLCQRYYEKSFNLETAPANGATTTGFASGVQNRWRIDWSASFTSGTINTPQMFIVPKRATPTIVQYGNSLGQVNVLNFSAGTNNWQDATSTPSGQLMFFQYTNAGFSTGQWGVVNFAFAASAEL
jgi:hypothetical protein